MTNTDIKYTDNDRKKDFEYFVKNYKKLYDEYGHTFIAIKNKQILGSYNSVLEAIANLEGSYDVGTYIIQECAEDESAYRTSIMRLLIGE